MYKTSQTVMTHKHYVLAEVMPVFSMRNTENDAYTEYYAAAKAAMHTVYQAASDYREDKCIP